jgi:hypothetical protein
MHKGQGQDLACVKNCLMEMGLVGWIFYVVV